MNSSHKLLSVVIPTRNRAEYARNLIGALRGAESDNFEVIVRDNSDKPVLEHFLKSFQDPRFIYDYAAESLSMHQNFDQAIGLATGTYVCALGDDDGILLREALIILGRAHELGVDAILTQKLTYDWPGVRHWFWGDIGGQISGSTLRARFECILDPHQELARVFRAGTTRSLGLLPRVYHGFVSRRSLHALHLKCGTHFPGASPDMSNAVGLVPFVNKILYSPRPAIVSGHSEKSGGGAGAAGRHHGRLQDQRHLPGETLVNWDNAIPRFWSGVTIYAQSAVAAARATATRPVPMLSYHRLYANCLVYEPWAYTKDVVAAARTLPGSKSLLALRVLAATFTTFIQRAIKFATNLIARTLRTRGVELSTMAEVLAVYDDPKPSGRCPPKPKAGIRQ